MQQLRIVLLSIVAAVTVGCGKDRTDPAEEAAAIKPDGLAVLEAAVSAHGLDAYRKLQAGEMRVLTEAYVTDQPDVITTISAFQLLDRLQELAIHGNRGDRNDRQTVSTYVRFGQKAWAQVDGGAFTPEEVRPIAALFPLQVIHQLLTFRLNTEFVRLDEKPAQGKPAIWIEVKQGELTAQFAFDPTTHLLIGSTTSEINSRTGKMGAAEIWYSDYRQYGGMSLPAKSVRYLDGKKLVERTLEFNILPTIDDAKLVKVLARDEVKPIVESIPTPTSPVPDPAEGPPATNKPNGRAVLEASVAAHGQDAYRKLQAGEIRTFIRNFVVADDITKASAFQLPDQLQERRIRGEIGASKVKEFVYVRFGQEAWTRIDSGAFAPDDVKPISMLYPLQVLQRLLEFRQNTKLVRLKDMPAQGRPAIWVEVTQGDFSGQFAFDPQTYLQIGSRLPAVYPKTGKTGVSETWYSDYRQYGGMVLPAKSVSYMDGEKQLEVTVLDFNTLPTIDDAKLLKVLTRDKVKPIVESVPMPNSRTPVP